MGEFDQSRGQIESPGKSALSNHDLGNTDWSDPMSGFFIVESSDFSEEVVHYGCQE
jgi:hypothetical protein